MNAFAETVPPAALFVFIAALGLILGSFVTALSYRLPRGISIAKGRSACPACGTTLTARDLVPVLSWLISRGACRTCGTRISWRYPAIELTMAVLFVTAALAVEDPARLALILAATPVMVALAVIDIEVRRLPNVLVALLAAAALVFRFLTDRDFVFAFAAAVAIFGFALLLDRIGRRLLHQGLGMGDAKLMSVVALALPLIPLLLVLGAAGTIGALTGVAWHRRLTGSATQIPFAPAILSAFWAALVAL